MKRKKISIYEELTGYNGLHQQISRFIIPTLFLEGFYEKELQLLKQNPQLTLKCDYNKLELLLHSEGNDVDSPLSHNPCFSFNEARYEAVIPSSFELLAISKQANLNWNLDYDFAKKTNNLFQPNRMNNLLLQSDNTSSSPLAICKIQPKYFYQKKEVIDITLFPADLIPNHLQDKFYAFKLTDKVGCYLIPKFDVK